MTEAGRTWGGRTGEERTARRRRQLLDAGLEVFGTRGWTGTTVQDLCSEAGLSRRYFYEHFDDREACFAAVLGRVAEEVEAVVRREAGAPGAPRARAEASFAALVDLVTADPRKARVAFVESFATPGLRARRVALLQAFAALASRLMASLHPEGADPRSLQLSAFVLSGAVAEVLVHAADGHPDVPAEALVERLTALYAAAARL